VYFLVSGYRGFYLIDKIDCILIFFPLYRLAFQVYSSDKPANLMAGAILTGTRKDRENTSEKQELKDVFER
jgi:hypothetical protein